MSRNLFATEEDVVAHRIIGDKALISRDSQGLWTSSKIAAFKAILQKENEDAETRHLKSIYQALIDLANLPYDNSIEVVDEFEGQSPVETAIDFLADEVPLNILLKEETVPFGRLSFFRLARRAIHMHGGPKPTHVTGHPVHTLVGALYPELEWNTAVEETRIMLLIVQRVKEGFPGTESLNMDVQGNQQAVAMNLTPGLTPPTQVGGSGNQPQPENEENATEIPVQAIPVQGPNSLFTEEQMAHARELQKNRSTNTSSDKIVNGEPPNTRATATEPPSVEDDEFFWYPVMTEQARQVGMRAIQTEFKPNQRFTNNKSDPDKLILIQDVHLKFKRLLKANRFTESAAREILPCLYDGTAGRKFNSLRRKDPFAKTDEIMASMEKTYVNSVTQRQASSEIKKLRLNPNSSTMRASVDNLVHRLNTFAVNCPASDRTDDAMINVLTHCTQSVEWAKPLRQALISKNVVDYDDACDVLSALATDEDITQGNTDTDESTVGINFARDSQKRGSGYSQARPAFDNRRLGTLRKAVQSFGQSRSNPVDRRTGKIMVCRSQGCGSTTHFQYSGKCPVEQARRKSGSSAIYMANTIESDLERGEDILGIFCEVLFSKSDDGVLDTDEQDLRLPTMPLDQAADRDVVEAGFVEAESELGQVGDYSYHSSDDAGINYNMASVDKSEHQDSDFWFGRH